MKNQGDITRELRRVPILLPTEHDAELAGHVLEKMMIDFVVCPFLSDLLEQIVEGCGLFILGDEVLSEIGIGRLMKTLDEQPEWSDLPAIIFLGRYPRWKTLNLIAARQSINLIQRPVKKKMLIIMVRTALEVRRRQYQIRDLLLELRKTNEKLGRRTILLQQLSLELTRSEERERCRIARILHDDLQQILVSAKIQTGMLKHSLNEETGGSVHTLSDTISRGIDISRSLSHELNP
jgi:signal transduction histidine kinase